MGHCEARGEPSENSAMYWERPCQCWWPLSVKPCMNRRRRWFAYHGQIGIRHIIIYTDPCWLARPQPEFWPWGRSVDDDRVSSFTCLGDVLRRDAQDVVGNEGVVVSNK